MDNVKDLTTLNDSDLVNVAGGYGYYEGGNSTDFCDACNGGAKKIFLVQGNPKISCRNCGKVYETCPKCGAAWDSAATHYNGHYDGALFWCISNHTFFATYDTTYYTR